MDKDVAGTVGLSHSAKAGEVTRIGEGVDIDQPQLRIGSERVRERSCNR